VLEEIVGEINDELDEIEKSYTKIDENNYIFEGRVQINDFYKILDIRENIFEDLKGDADTLAGLILELTGKLPKKHEVIDHKYFKFKVKSADDRKFKQLYVTTKETFTKINEQ